jgi:thiamine-phosphate pyrophosphorylase
MDAKTRGGLTPRAWLRRHPESLRLYAVTDSSWLKGRSLAECVRQALAGGATFVQLREKGMPTQELVAYGRDVRDAAAKVPFVIDDDVQAAIELGADGVHVGQEDMACAQARELLGPDAIVGVSAQTVDQAVAAEAAGADYLGVGALIPTATKTDAADVSPETLAAICAAVSIPVVGIGGLHVSTMGIMRGTGVQGAAVVSGIFAADDCEQAARELRAAVDAVVL